MKSVIILIVFLFFIISGILSAQEKKFELSYDISGWYEKEKRIEPSTGNTYFLNNNLKMGYKMCPFFSLGLSGNYYFKKYDSKTAAIKLVDGSLFQYYTDKNLEFAWGPYTKIGLGKKFKFSLLIEYNYSYGSNKYEINEEWRNNSYSGQNNYDIQYFATQIEIGKEMINNITVNLIFIEKLPFYDFSSLKLDSRSFQKFVGVGVTYYLNLKVESK
jgi:hypothetical protein